ncbi:MAG TPA: S1 RNA-binding domain-containing protein [Nanoarchaeota archaeon]|nr:S1 RNA-binding domain-containing protein [Nanoarchaeota archaeon]
MPRKPYEFPEEGELVIGKVKEINPHSAVIELLEYPGKEGMVHISEVARKWVRDIRNFVKPSQIVVALVLQVDEKKNFIALSLKRVNQRDKEKKLKEYRREEKAEKMLELVAKELKITLDEAYEKIGFFLYEEFGEMYKGFLTAREKPELLIKKGLDKKYAEIVKKIAEKAIEIREREFKAEIELKCFEGDGINRIKKVLNAIKKKFGVEIKYIASPKYMLVLKHKDPKKAEKILEQIEKFGEKEAKKLKCEFSMKRVK